MLKHFVLGFTFCLGAASALSQTFSDIKADANKSAYVQDSRGVITRSPFGLCWRTGYWTPTDAVTGCDGELVPPIAKPTAPAIASPATPAPALSPKRCDFAVTLGNDQTFPFNGTALSSAAKKRIDDEVPPKLNNCAKVDLVLVTGHADRLGSQQYNQKLSEKRANAVAAYLRSKGVTTEPEIFSAGKTQAVKACDDKMPRAQLIECLAPNRRVVIEGRGLAK